GAPFRYGELGRGLQPPAERDQRLLGADHRALRARARCARPQRRGDGGAALRRAGGDRGRGRNRRLNDRSTPVTGLAPDVAIRRAVALSSAPKVGVFHSGGPVMNSKNRSSLLFSLIPTFLAVSISTALVPQEGRAQSAEQARWSDPATWPNGK